MIIILPAEGNSAYSGNNGASDVLAQKEQFIHLLSKIFLLRRHECDNGIYECLIKPILS